MVRTTRRTFSACAAAVALAFTCAFLPGCATQSSTSGASSSQSTTQNAGFQTKDVPVVHNDGEHGSITLRFYDDLPNIAYVSATDYHVLMNPEATAKAEQKGDAWTITSSTGTATIDTTADTISSDDFYAFVNTERVSADGTGGVSIACVKLMGIKKEPSTATTSFDLAKYGIDLRSDDEGVYLPFTLASSLYCNDDTAHRSAFNGEKVVVNDMPMVSYMIQADPSYSAPLFGQLTRPDDVVAQSYAEWCFALENLYGYPGSEIINEKILREQGLEAALKDQGSAGDKIVALLKSSDMGEYLYGTAILNALFNDGHSFLNLIGMNMISADTAPELYKVVSAAQEKLAKDEDIVALYNKGMGAATQASTDDAGRTAQRTKILGADSVRKEGDTLLVAFDRFSGDDAAWAEYYASDKHDLDALLKSEAAQKDSVMIFLNALREAQADPAIKNIVIDLSSNTGGDSNVLMAIMSLMGGDSLLNYEDVLTGQKVTLSYDVDRNFDGTFDEKDDEVSYDYNFAVITSAASFSCGNALPAMMKDAGMPTLGEKSRGGACMIMPLSTQEGFDYMISGYRARLINKAGENIDGGVPVDVDLLQHEADGSVKTTEVEVSMLNEKGEMAPQKYTMANYSQFWDLKTLSKAVNEFYAKS